MRVSSSASDLTKAAHGKLLKIKNPMSMNKVERVHSESMLKLEEANNLQKRISDTYQRLEQFKHAGTILSWQQMQQKFEILQIIEDLRQERDKKLNDLYWCFDAVLCVNEFENIRDAGSDIVSSFFSRRKLYRINLC